MAGGTKKRKFKKSKPCNLRYKAEHRHEKGHIRRIKRHIDRYDPKLNDTVADKALVAYKAQIGMR